jgi:hypothetical protein
VGRQRVSGLPRPVPEVAQPRAASRQHLLLAADLAGSLEVRGRQRPTRGDIRLLAPRGDELVVEVGVRLQEPVAQLLELVLLEEEVLADAGVERQTTNNTGSQGASIYGAPSCGTVVSTTIACGEGRLMGRAQ